MNKKERLKMLKNIKISTKLSTGYGLGVIALIVVCAIAFFKIAGLQHVVADLSETHIPLFDVVKGIDASATEQDLAVTQFALHGDEKFISKYEKLNQFISEKFKIAISLVKNNPKLMQKDWLPSIDKIAAQHAKFAKSCNTYINAIKAGHPIDQLEILAGDVAVQLAGLVDHTERFIKMNNQESKAVTKLADRTTQSARLTISIVGIFTVVSGVIFALIIIRSITRPISQTIDSLEKSADQVASASEQVSSASQSLAEGSSQQAASIEETSSSLEEMSHMTKRTAEHSTQADNLVKEVDRIVESAQNSMNELIRAMDDISKASDEKSKIIKTIDEIAFQTNLLALNAAVEVARAGEAGAGFAVVADEVRNLALRAADAAKNTTNLIEGTVERVNHVSVIVNRTKKGFCEVADSSKKVGELVGEIAAAANEQAQGISQVNTAVTEMDKLIQQNAASAEESASAAEELYAHAEQLKAIVQNLVNLVGSSASKLPKGAFARQNDVKSPPLEQSTVSLQNFEKTGFEVGKAREMNPELVIPMDDSDFKDF
jgi:methyl-accepting chemotaxis protein